MTGCIVRRWARYGHERLYVEDAAGVQLGYFDVHTSRYHADDIDNLPLLQIAIRDHQAVDAVHQPPTPPPPPAYDLAANLPGAAARERALAERESQGRFRHGLARLIDAKTNERAWRIGADGERAVAEQLDKLRQGWHVLHAVGVGEHGADIDHVVIGPGGVFTVNAKHHPHARIWVGGDTFLVNGQRVPYIRNSRHEARRASKLLTDQVEFPVAVTGVVAVMGAHKGFTVKGQPEDGAVVVVRRKRISQHLAKLPLLLDARAVDAIHEAARRSTTWHPR